MNKSILFATTNSHMMAEARSTCQPYGISVVQTKLEIDEIQSKDFVPVSAHKAVTAFELTGRLVVVMDTAWDIPAINGFPGAYMNEVADWLSTNDFINLMANTSDGRICFIESIVYAGSKKTKVFSKRYWEHY